MTQEKFNLNWRQIDFDDDKQTFCNVIHIPNKEKYNLIKSMSASFSNDIFQQRELEKHKEKRIAMVEELASLSLQDLYKEAPKYRVVPKELYDFQSQVINGMHFRCPAGVFRWLVRYTIAYIENLRAIPDNNKLIELSKLSIDEIVDKYNQLPLPMA